MIENKIILKKGLKPKVDYVAIIICILTILLLVIQIAADRHFANANRAFIEKEKAKRVALQVKERKAQMAKQLQSIRIKQQQEEETFAFEMENKTKKKEGQVLARTQQGMDYRKKLEIYRNANKAPNQRR